MSVGDPSDAPSFSPMPSPGATPGASPGPTPEGSPNLSLKKRGGTVRRIVGTLRKKSSNGAGGEQGMGLHKTTSSTSVTRDDNGPRGSIVSNLLAAENYSFSSSSNDLNQGGEVANTLQLPPGVAAKAAGDEFLSSAEVQNAMNALDQLEDVYEDLKCRPSISLSSLPRPPSPPANSHLASENLPSTGMRKRSSLSSLPDLPPNVSQLASSQTSPSQPQLPPHVPSTGLFKVSRSSLSSLPPLPPNPPPITSHPASGVSTTSASGMYPGSRSSLASLSSLPGQQPNQSPPSGSISVSGLPPTMINVQSSGMHPGSRSSLSSLSSLPGLPSSSLPSPSSLPPVPPNYTTPCVYPVSTAIPEGMALPDMPTFLPPPGNEDDYGDEYQSMIGAAVEIQAKEGTAGELGQQDTADVLDLADSLSEFLEDECYMDMAQMPTKTPSPQGSTPATAADTAVPNTSPSHDLPEPQSRQTPTKPNKHRPLPTAANSAAHVTGHNAPSNSAETSNAFPFPPPSMIASSGKGAAPVPIPKPMPKPRNNLQRAVSSMSGTSESGRENCSRTSSVGSLGGSPKARPVPPPKPMSDERSSLNLPGSAGSLRQFTGDLEPSPESQLTAPLAAPPKPRRSSEVGKTLISSLVRDAVGTDMSATPPSTGSVKPPTLPPMPVTRMPMNLPPSPTCPSVVRRSHAEGGPATPPAVPKPMAGVVHRNSAMSTPASPVLGTREIHFDSAESSLPPRQPPRSAEPSLPPRNGSRGGRRGSKDLLKNQIDESSAPSASCSLLYKETPMPPPRTGRRASQETLPAIDLVRAALPMPPVGPSPTADVADNTMPQVSGAFPFARRTAPLPPMPSSGPPPLNMNELKTGTQTQPSTAAPDCALLPTATGPMFLSALLLGRSGSVGSRPSSPKSTQAGIPEKRVAMPSYAMPMKKNRASHTNSGERALPSPPGDNPLVNRSRGGSQITRSSTDSRRSLAIDDRPQLPIPPRDEDTALSLPNHNGPRHHSSPCLQGLPPIPPPQSSSDPAQKPFETVQVVPRVAPQMPRHPPPPLTLEEQRQADEPYTDEEFFTMVAINDKRSSVVFVTPVNEDNSGSSQSPVENSPLSPMSPKPMPRTLSLNMKRGSSKRT